jgi:hypothetical protein
MSIAVNRECSLVYNLSAQKLPSMAATAAASAAPPIPLEARLRLSQLNVRFKVRGTDEVFSIRGDRVYHYEVLYITQTNRVSRY